MTSRLFVSLGLAIALVCAIAGHPGAAGSAVPLGLDLYLPAPPDNPITAAKAELGRRLFFERRLSADRQTSCATCHQPERRFADGRPVARGAFGRDGRRNVPSILNRAYGTSFSWDGRASTLEEQVRNAVSGEADLGSSLADAAARLSRDQSYVRAFAAAFDRGITGDRIGQALATFVRTQLSADSAVDRFMAGNPRALTDEARRGRDLFTGAARCSRCHSGPLLSDEQFHNTGVSWGRDDGRLGVTQAAADRGRFKTPSLRNVALTAPYMHDGSVPDLAAAIDFYADGGRANPNLDEDVRPLQLTAADRRALIAFLHALSSRTP